MNYLYFHLNNRTPKRTTLKKMFSVITTEDGSHSIKNELLNETYHSVKGAITESMHVYIQHGLLSFSNEKNELHIIEMGFGTGLNALLTCMHRPENCKIIYKAIEKFPIDVKLLNELNFIKILNEKTKKYERILNSKPIIPNHIDPNFSFRIFYTDFLSFNSEKADLMYYDAFSPKTQPELWSIEAMEHCAKLLKPGGKLLTYCAQGQFRRNLKEAGFLVESLQGPPGKHQITRAVLGK